MFNLKTWLGHPDAPAPVPLTKKETEDDRINELNKQRTLTDQQGIQQQEYNNQFKAKKPVNGSIGIRL